MPHLLLQNLSKHYGATVALKQVDLAVENGELLTLLGPSGCGKTTVLRLVAGFLQPSGGSIRIGDVDVTRVLPNERGIGMVFQSYALFPHLSVAKNIAFGLEERGFARSYTRHRVAELLDLIRLTEVADRFPAQLSGGMRQRVCIARTLVLRPRLILLDEPFGALDQQTRLLMGDELLRLWREIGATVLLITHALDEAAMLSDRVGVMSARPGRFIDMVETGWPRDRDSRIVSDPEFGSFTARLWSCLREESLKTMGRAA